MKLKERLLLASVRAGLHLLGVFAPSLAARKAFALFCTPRRRTLTPPGEIFRRGEPLSFLLEGSTIRGHRWQPAGPATRKVLIIHGFESGSVNYEAYVARFLRKGYEVLAFDAPAHGLSEGQRINIPMYMHMIRLICAEYGPVRSFVAHSLGAMALTLYLESVPHDEDTRIALIAPVVEASAAVDMFFRLLRLGNRVRVAFEAYERSVFRAPFSWFSLERALPHVRAGILWVQDEDDDITPLQHAMPIKDAAHAHIRFVITSGLGHRKIYRDASVLQQVVDHC